MIPIYEQGSGKGIGHSLDSFLEQFNAICRHHIEEKRAKAFAFIFYDFSDNSLRRILKDQGVFTQLDRLSGNDLSIFFLHAGTAKTIKKFNKTLLAVLGIKDQATLPCVVFFRLGQDDEEFGDISLAQLDHSDLVHGFRELFDVIERYIDADSDVDESGLRAMTWVQNAGGFVTLEAFRAALRAVFGSFM